jgi:ABC-type glycerol-3-phosphate transport system permease component
MHIRRSEKVLSWAVLAALILVVLIPLSWAVFTSLKSEASVMAYPPTFFPTEPSLSAYKAVFRNETFGSDLFNSVLYAVGAVALAVLLSAPAGYAASRFEFRGKRTVMLLILSTSMIPGVALLVPTYFLLDALGLLNNAAVIIVVQAARLVPQTVWFMQNFVDAVPRELDEATQVDGANHWQTFTKVILPLVTTSPWPRSRPRSRTARCRWPWSTRCSTASASPGRTSWPTPWCPPFPSSPSSCSRSDGSSAA